MGLLRYEFRNSGFHLFQSQDEAQYTDCLIIIIKKVLLNDARWNANKRYAYTSSLEVYALCLSI